MDCLLEIFDIDISLRLGDPSEEDAFDDYLMWFRFLSYSIDAFQVGLLELARENEVEVEREVDGGLQGEALLLLENFLVALALLFECDYLTEFR